MFKKYFCCYKKLSEHLASGGISDVDKELLRYERYLKINGIWEDHILTSLINHRDY